MISYEEATNDERQIQAINEEIQSVEKNNTWELNTLPVVKKPISVKQVYKTKYKVDGKVD